MMVNLIISQFEACEQKLSYRLNSKSFWKFCF